MSAISTPSRFAKPRTPMPRSASINDVTDCVKSWGRRGIFFGACFGFTFGAIFVAIPFTSDVLTFGVVGTLLVGAVECAVIAGGFAALAAAIFANGVPGRNSAQFEGVLTAGRRSAATGLPGIPLTDWPVSWAPSVEPTVLDLQQVPEEVLNSAFSSPDDEARLDTIDTFENGNTEP